MHKILLCFLFFQLGVMLHAQDRNYAYRVYYPPGAFYDADDPTGSGRVIDVTQPPFNATGDGVTDDTQALKDAYNFVAARFIENGWRSTTNNDGSWMIYLPAGTYLVSNTIVHDSIVPPLPGVNDLNAEGVSWVRFAGEDRATTTIKLADNSPGFGPGARKEVLSYDPRGRGLRDGSNIPAANQLSDLTINTGSGNPGAVGVRYIAANLGEIERVTITSDDGQGDIGLWLPQLSVQGYYRDITINGFDYGLYSELRGEVNPTLEYVTLNNQNIAGYLLDDLGSANMRKVRSNNAVPFAQIKGSGSHVVLIDSELNGGAAGATAIEMPSATAQLFARNVTVAGYGASVSQMGAANVTGDIAEYVSDMPYTLFEGFAPVSLNLPVAESPIVNWPQTEDQWANVDDFPGNTVTEKIQNAMNSGRPGVYFPKARYVLDATITVPPTVEVIEMLYSRLNDGGLFDIQAGTMPLAIYHVNRNASNIVQTGPRPVVIRNATFDVFDYTGTGATTLYLESSGRLGGSENFCPAGMTVYARAHNIESKQRSGLLLTGGTLWGMGFKAESPQNSFEVRPGSRFEMLGGTRTDVNKSVQPMLNVDNAEATLVANNFLGGQTEFWVQEKQGNVTQMLASTQLPNRVGTNGHYLPLFIASTEADNPDCLSPIDPAVTADTTKATLSLTNRASAPTSFEFRYRLVGETDWIVLTGLPQASVELTDLSPGERYEFEGRSVCSGGETSDWSATGFFTTAVGVRFSLAAPIIDGTLSEVDWGLTTVVDKVASGVTDNAANFDLLWDETNLYVAVNVADANLVNDSDEDFRDDAVEVFLDVNNNGGGYDAGDVQIIKGFNSTGLFTSRTFTGTIQHASAATAGGYVVELAIPWSGLGINPINGFNLGIDIGVDDDDDGDSRDGQLVWSGTGANFNNTDAFGDALLFGQSARAPAEAALYWTWDNITTDEVSGKETTLQNGVASFAVQGVDGAAGLLISGDGVTPAVDAAVLIPNEGNNLLNSGFSSRSYALWVKAEDTQPVQLLFEEGGDGGGVAFQLSNGNLEVYFRHGSGADFSVTAVDYPDDGLWHLLTVGYANGAYEIFIDGQSVGSGAGGATSIPNHANPASLGGIRNDQSPTNDDGVYLRGYLDEFRVFTTRIVSTDIENLRVAPTALTATATELTLAPGDQTEPLTVRPEPSFSLLDYNYTSSNEAVATVNADGVVTAVAGGTATITITGAAGTAQGTPASATVAVTVDADAAAAEPALYWTWDNVLDDEVLGKASTFESGVASFSPAGVSGAAGVAVAGGTADNGAIVIANAGNNLLNSAFDVRSYALWVKAVDAKDTQILFEEGGDGAGVAMQLNGGNLEVLFRYGGGANFHETIVNYPDDGLWHLVAVSYDRGQYQIFIDGAVVGSGNSPTATVGAHANPASLGGIRNNQSASNNDGNYLNGLLDEFRVYTESIDGSDLFVLRVAPLELKSDISDVSLEEGEQSAAIGVTREPVYSLPTLSFVSSDTDVATVNGQGVITAVGAGTATITVSGVTGTVSGSPATTTVRVNVTRAPATPALYWTWDNVTTDQITGKESTFTSVASFTENGVANQGVAVAGDGSTAAVNGAVNLANGGLLNASFTQRSYALWVRADDTQPIQTLFEEGGDGAGAGFQLKGGNLEVLFRHGSGTAFSETVVNYPDDAAWHLIVVVYDGGNYEIFIDGVSAGVGASTATTIGNHSNPASLGGIRNDQSPTNDSGVYFQGELDEFRLFTVPLVQADIENLRVEPLAVTADISEVALDPGEKSDPITATLMPVFSTQELKFTSSNESVATVDEDGIITGLNPGTANITISSGSGDQNQGGMTAASDVITVNVVGPAPVSWLAFDGAARAKDVLLTWATATEVDNEGFTVQRSADGIHFDNLGFVTGRNTAGTYSFVDTEPLVGPAYYRLLQQDFDGTTDYSAVIYVIWLASDRAVVFPNPAGRQLTLRGLPESAAGHQAWLIDAEGRRVRQINVMNHKAITVGDLSAGVYHLLVNITDAPPVRLRFVKR